MLVTTPPQGMLCYLAYVLYSTFVINWKLSCYHVISDLRGIPDFFACTVSLNGYKSSLLDGLNI